MISETVRRAQAGDQQAFAALFLEHKSRVHNTCLKVVRDPVLAEDLTQETFIRVLLMLPTFRGQAEFKTWLYRVAWNTSVMHVRKAQLRDRRVPTVSLEVDTEDPDQTHTQDLAVRDGQLECTPLRLQLEHVIPLLPPCQQQIFCMHYIDGLECHEIADRLNIALGSVKSACCRARFNVRRLMKIKLRRPRLPQ